MKQFRKIRVFYTDGSFSDHGIEIGGEELFYEAIRFREGFSHTEENGFYEK